MSDIRLNKETASVEMLLWICAAGGVGFGIWQESIGAAIFAGAALVVLGGALVDVSMAIRGDK
jgi:drug/metabolite transporter (DMT)-like permease